MGKSRTTICAYCNCMKEWPLLPMRYLFDPERSVDDRRLCVLFVVLPSTTDGFAIEKLNVFDASTKLRYCRPAVRPGGAGVGHLLGS